MGLNNFTNPDNHEPRGLSTLGSGIYHPVGKTDEHTYAYGTFGIHGSINCRLK